MSKDLEISRLCDAYGALITENMRFAVREYYDCDMSLAEIGEELGISRQAVLCRLRQAEDKLREYEDCLGIVGKSDEIKSELVAVRREMTTDIESAEKRIDKIINIL